MERHNPGASFFSAPYIAAEPGRAKRSPYIWGGKKGEFRNLTRMSTDPTATLKLNYTEKVSKMRNILSYWEYRRLTLIGKIQVIKRLALSQLTYILTPLATNQKFPVVLNFCRLLFSISWKQFFSCLVILGFFRCSRPN